MNSRTLPRTTLCGLEALPGAGDNETLFSGSRLGGGASPTCPRCHLTVGMFISLKRNISEVAVMESLPELMLTTVYVFKSAATRISPALLSFRLE